MAVIRLNPISDFYFSPAELGDWVREWVRQHRLHFLFARSHFRDEARPRFEVRRRLAWADRGAVTRAIRDYCFLYLSVAPLRADVANLNLLAVANRDWLRFVLPAFSSRGMTGVGVQVGSDGTNEQVYQAIAADLRDRTEPGAWFRLARDDRNEDFDPTCRYAPGAAQLLEQGVPLAAGGDMVVARFGTERRLVRGRAEPGAAPGRSGARHQPGPRSPRRRSG
jgi:hypothetical protein